MNLWKVANGELKEVSATQLDFEKRLEGWIAEDLSILGTDVLIIGKQVSTGFGGKIDLLGIDPQGNAVIMELKRDKTHREVVAQLLDYATWVKTLSYNDLDAITKGFLKKDLSAAFSDRFGGPIPEKVNTTHSMIIVAAEFDHSSERIVEYLAEEHDMNINAVLFRFFKVDGSEFLGRAWLMDPMEVQERSDSGKQAPWHGYWFVNVGAGVHRTWNDNTRYGYIGAGQGVKYSDALTRLKVGSKIFAYMKGLGYVGHG